MRLALFILVISLYSQAVSFDFLFDNNVTCLKYNDYAKLGLDKCRYPRELLGYSDKFEILGHKVTEVILRFDDKNIIKSCSFLIDYSTKQNDYNRFSQLESEVKKKITDLRKSQPFAKKKHTFPNKRTIDLEYWETPFSRIYVISRIKIEQGGDMAFVTIRWERKNAPPAAFKTWFSPHKRYIPSVEIEGTSHKLFVPMRKQLGGTGGCWYTTIVRQLEYIGSEWDSVCCYVAFGSGEDAAGKDCGKKYGFDYKTIDFQDSGRARQLCLEAIKFHDNLADKKGLPRIIANLNDSTKVWNEFGNLNADIWKKVPLPKENIKRFQDIVIKHIDKGIPLGWSVVRHSASGKHRRMIIGYDLINDKLYYSDSWGVSSDIKEMSFSCAALMTVWMQTITP